MQPFTSHAISAGSSVAIRTSEMTEKAHEDTSRIDTAQRVFLNNGNLDLNTLFAWHVYGQAFSIP